LRTPSRVGLTPQQAAVLEQLLLGRTQAAIAAALNLAPSTVDHAMHALRKAHHVPSTLALVCLVWRNRSQAALAGFERRSGRDRRES
jgi:DNA-binding NarL/FixJ family response regulator